MDQAPSGHSPACGERDGAVADLFAEHQGPMLRLATLLGADDPEDIVGEAFYQVFRRWNRLRDPSAAVAYLRAVTCNLVRMRVRHLQVARRHQWRAGPAPVLSDTTSAEGELREDQRRLLGALEQLPTRQREALVLRYWLDLSQTEIATTMGISAGAVKSHTSRGMATLTQLLGHNPPPERIKRRRATRAERLLPALTTRAMSGRKPV